MFKNKNNLHLLKRDLFICTLVILCLIVVIIPIYLKCSDVVYENLQDKLERDIEFGAELVENEIDAQNLVIEKLKISHKYNSMRKKTGTISPKDNVDLNEMQDYYSDLCTAFFIQERTFLLFNKNDIIIERNSISPYAMNVYGYSWSVNDFTYDEFKEKLFERAYYGEFHTDMKFRERNSEKLVYIKTIGSSSNKENSVMVSVFDFDEIIKQCGLEEIAKSGNIYIRNWNGEELESSVKTKKTAMQVEHKFQAVPVSITAEVSEEYVGNCMHDVRKVIVIYFVLAILVMMAIVFIYAYKHWKMVSVIADVFGDEEMVEKGVYNIDHKFINEHRQRLDGQKRRISELETEKKFLQLIQSRIEDDDLTLLSDSVMSNVDSYCILMMEIEENPDCTQDEFINRFYQSHIDILFHTTIHRELIVLLLGADSLNIGEVKKLAHEMIYEDSIKIKFVISDIKHELSEASGTVKQMENLLKYIENSSFVQMNEIKRDEKYDNYISFEYTKKLYEHIMEGNMRLAVRHVYEQWYYLAENPSITDEISKLFYWQYGVIAQTAAELGYNGRLPVFRNGNNITEIAQEIIAVVEKLASIAGEKRNIGINRSQQIIKYINENCYDSQFYMQNICDKFMLSERTVSEIVKNETGMRFSDYIGEMRIKQVEKLLSTTDISINDIAQMCGFSSNNALYKAFKRVHSLSPTQYRADTNDAKM